ncbi:MAG: hypothetical protein N2200_09340, partial [Bacteroidia bacterium]|nr:hypothetical protein [Bacteroidia bacterium]
EAAFFQPLNGAVFWWSVFVAGYGAILLLNREERAAAFALPIIVGLGGGEVLLLHPKIASLPANPISHGVFRYSVLQIAMIVAAIVGLLQYNYTRQRLLNREMQLSDALARQEEANAQLLAEKQLSEQRRQQVEAALVQIEQLREQERLSREREAFLVRYETLMRKGYTLSLEEFADQLLIELSKDITIFGGIFYVRDGQGWVVKASYAFPEKVGTYVSGGTLRTAEVVRQPYLISPAPMATIDIRSGLLRPRPKGVLYLPFYSEVTHEVACIVEVVLAETLKPETLERLETLLPRIGTYWWVRSQPLQKSSIHS